MKKFAGTQKFRVGAFNAKKWICCQAKLKYLGSGKKGDSHHSGREGQKEQDPNAKRKECEELRARGERQRYERETDLTALVKGRGRNLVREGRGMILPERGGVGLDARD